MKCLTKGKMVRKRGSPTGIFNLSLSSLFCMYSSMTGVADMSAAAVGGGISIAPPELILPPGQSASVEITLSVTPDRIGLLTHQYLLLKKRFR